MPSITWSIQTDPTQVQRGLNSAIELINVDKSITYGDYYITNIISCLLFFQIAQFFMSASEMAWLVF